MEESSSKVLWLIVGMAVVAIVGIFAIQTVAPEFTSAIMEKINNTIISLGG